MFSIPASLYELGTSSRSDAYDSNSFFHGFLSSQDAHQNLQLIPTSMADERALAASNSHKEAERRRRKRINAHIATLKSVLPNTIKTDKASLLGEAVRLIRELKTTTSEVLSESNDIESSNTPLKFMFPTERDELSLSQCNGLDSGLTKATLCCDDRPEMIFDLIQALKSAEAIVERAEMSTIGGRTKIVLWVKLTSSGNNDVEGENDAGLGRLRRALKTVMDKSTSLSGSGQFFQGQKRARYYQY